MSPSTQEVTVGEPLSLRPAQTPQQGSGKEGGGSELPGSIRLGKIWVSIKRKMCRKNDVTGNIFKGFSRQAKGMMVLYSGGMIKGFEQVSNLVR